VDIFDRQCDSSRALPVPDRLLARAVEAERHRGSVELRPEIVPFLAASESKELLVERASAAHVASAIHHEIHRAHRDWRFAPRRALALGVLLLLWCHCWPR